MNPEHIGIVLHITVCGSGRALCHESCAYIAYHPRTPRCELFNCNLEPNDPGAWRCVECACSPYGVQS